MDVYMKSGKAGGKVLGDVLLLSGSLAAVARTMFSTSGKTWLAAILPAALATTTCFKLGHRMQQERQIKVIQELVRKMLHEMMVLKQSLKKSLNIIHGMETINQGYMFVVNRIKPTP